MNDARNSLCTILSSSDCNRGAFYVLRFSTRHQTLRRRFIAQERVIEAVMHAMEWTRNDPNEHLFLLVMDSLRYLINDGAYDQRGLVACSSSTDDLRGNVINQLRVMSEPSDRTETRLYAALEVKSNGVLLVTYSAS